MQDLQTDVWIRFPYQDDSDGNLIEDAPALTDDDVAVFEEFLASFTAQ